MTATLGDDTRGVELESLLVSFDTDRNGFLVKSDGQLVRVLGLNRDVGLGLEDNLGSIVLASTVLSSVGIVSFSFNTILDDVVISRGQVTTVATFVLGRAINDLLFGEGSQVTSGNSVGTFKTTSGGESPT